MYMLNPDLLQLNPIHFQNSQWARAPGPGPKNCAWVRARSHGTKHILGPRARGPGPLASFEKYKPRHLGFFEKVNSIEMEEVWAEHIHIAPQGDMQLGYREQGSY